MNEWKTERLGALAAFINGMAFKPRDWDTHGLPIIRIQNLNGSQEFNYFNQPVDDRYLVHQGDLLFSWSGSRGTSFGPHLWQGNQGVLNQHIFRVVILGDLSRDYLFHALRQITQEIERRAHGSAGLVHITKGELERFRIPVPSLTEQIKIAQILSTWDEAIAAADQLVAALQRRKKGLMQRLLTGQVRFPEFVVSQQAQATRYGAIPVDWGYEPIGDIAMEISVKNRENGPLPVLSCTKYDGLVDSLEYFGRQIFSQDTSTYKVVKRGQFAYATNHIEEGSIGYQDLYDEALISPMYTVFQANERVDDAFLYRLLKTELYRHIFEVNTSGTVNRRGRLGWDDFARIKVPLPGLPEQRRIAEFFYVVDQEIEVAKKQVEALKTQKKGLMQRLLTGQVRVPVKEEQDYAPQLQ